MGDNDNGIFGYHCIKFEYSCSKHELYIGENVKESSGLEALNVANDGRGGSLGVLVLENSVEADDIVEVEED